MNTNNKKRKLLLIVLPFIVESIFAKGVKTRSFLAFPYAYKTDLNLKRRSWLIFNFKSLFSVIYRNGKGRGTHLGPQTLDFN